jgi:hypothetical protein
MEVKEGTTPKIEVNTNHGQVAGEIDNSEKNLHFINVTVRNDLQQAQQQQQALGSIFDHEVDILTKKKERETTVLKTLGIKEIDDHEITAIAALCSAGANTDVVSSLWKDKTLQFVDGQLKLKNTKFWPLIALVMMIIVVYVVFEAIAVPVEMMNERFMPALSFIAIMLTWLAYMVFQSFDIVRTARRAQKTEKFIVIANQSIEMKANTKL